MVLFLMSFWDSKGGQEALVLVGLQIVAFFAINPFLISLADWRNTVTEEADALMHASVQTMMHLKSVVRARARVRVRKGLGLARACRP